MTFGALGVISIGPPCRPGGPAELTMSRTASVRCDAAMSASWRSAIGVVPA